MRLIDADKIDYIMEDDKNPSYLDYVRRPHIDDEPTIKAIPIEFIEERIKKAIAFTHSKAEGNIIDDGCVVTVVSASFTAQVLANLLEAWEGQNEKDI